MTDPLCLLQVHAHPDDEASKGAGTMARYAAEGVRGVLVTCTGGEAGDILNPAMDRPEIGSNLHRVRMEELAASVRIIGYERLHLLGYRDSGMPDSDANKHPDNFANADFDEAVDRLARIIRLERPQVMLTYADDQSRYPHPDHLRVHDISHPAIRRAADPGWEPDVDRPWQVCKVYYASTFSRARMQTMHDWFVEQRLESPFAEWLDKVPLDSDDRLTTRIDVGDYLGRAREALLAHRTQVAPDSRWMRIPVEVLRERHPFEDFTLAESIVDHSIPETDLFAGIR